MKGDMILSPYTVWHAKLACVNKGQSNFKELEKYIEEINMLALVGEGYYVDETQMDQQSKDQLDVDHYYRTGIKVTPIGDYIE
jgi:hypothetical protein